MSQNQLWRMGTPTSVSKVKPESEGSTLFFARVAPSSVAPLFLSRAYALPSARVLVVCGQALVRVNRGYFST